MVSSRDAKSYRRGQVETLALPGAQERPQIGGDVLPGSQRGWAWARTEGIYCCCSVAQLCLTLLWPHRLQQARLLCPWDFPDKNTGVGGHFLLQGIFPTRDHECICILFSHYWRLYAIFSLLKPSKIWAPNHFWYYQCISLVLGCIWPVRENLVLKVLWHHWT